MSARKATKLPRLSTNQSAALNVVEFNTVTTLHMFSGGTIRSLLDKGLIVQHGRGSKFRLPSFRLTARGKECIR